MNLVKACEKFPILGRDFCEKRDRYSKWVTNEHRNIVRSKASYRVVLAYLAVEAAWLRLWLAAAIERAERYAEMYEECGVEWHHLQSLGCGMIYTNPSTGVSYPTESVPSVDWLTPSPFVGGEDGEA